MPLKDQSNSTAMKPAVDEMFPEGAGPYVDLDEFVSTVLTSVFIYSVLITLAAVTVEEPNFNSLKEKCEAKDVVSAGHHAAGGSTGLLMDLAANEKAVHADFFNDFEDLFDDDDIQ